MVIWASVGDTLYYHPMVINIKTKNKIYTSSSTGSREEGLVKFNLSHMVIYFMSAAHRT